MLMASRHPQMDTFNAASSHPTEEEILFNPAEHKDLAHFFSHVDQTETFALTANEWLGIRSGGAQFNPVGSVGPDPGRSNTALANATRSLMSFNTPVAVSNPNNHHQRPPQSSMQNSLQNMSLPPLSPAAPSVRAWRPHETPFDPSIHGGSTERGGGAVVRRASTSTMGQHPHHQHRSNRDHSADAAGNRKRSAPAVPHSDSLPSKRARSISNANAPNHSSNSAPPIIVPAGGPTAGPSSAASSDVSMNGPPPVVTSAASSSKPPLLTAQQKKANHILSEQKRRAKIRRGYDALCEVVPSLRSAVQAEQEFGDAKRKKGKSTKGSGVDTLDGRAGPKSESIVLSQTIEYMEHLVAKKEMLLARLRKAQSMLPAGHSVSNGNPAPIWEKEWDGGTGVEEGDEDEDESDDEDTA